MRRIIFGLVVTLSLGSITACGGSSSSSTSGGSSPSALPSSINAAVESYPPYTTLTGGKLGGMESEMFDTCASSIHSKVVPQVLDFTGMLASAQAGRADVAFGSISFTAQRAQAGLFTDPPYYAPVVMAERAGTHITTVTGMQGKKIGVQTGSDYIPVVQQIKGASLHTYDSIAAAFEDLSAGRVDVLIFDPLLMIYEAKTRPDLHLETDPLTPPTSAEIKAHPSYILIRTDQLGWYLSKSHKALETALTGCIRRMYADGTMARIVSKYAGPTQVQAFLCPAPYQTARRVGVDRPVGWKAPSITGCPPQGA